MKTIFTGSSAQTFLTDLRYSLSGDQLTVLLLSLPKYPAHAVTDKMIRLQSKSLTADLGCPSANWLIDTLMAESGFNYGQTVTSTERQ